MPHPGSTSPSARGGRVGGKLEVMIRSQQGRGNQEQASAKGADKRLVDLSVDLPPLDDDELASLRQVGAHWAAAIGHRGPAAVALPVDPGLHHYPEAAQVDGGGRFAPVDLRTAEATGEVLATEQATQPLTGPGRLLFWTRRVVVGHPRDSSAVTHERMRKLVALPVLASDALSSIAYGPEAMLAVLVAAGTSALSLSLPIAAAVAVLMVTVGLSYRQTIRAYRSAGGSYIVAGDNLGVVAGLTAGASLMIDYVMTVAVSITSAIPALRPASVLLGVAAIGVLLAGNLRGVREAGAIFAAPTYAYILAVLLLVGVGLIDAAERGFHPSPPPHLSATQAVSLLLILRAFASGATAMTGIEAISNAVPAFQPEPWRNARTTLTWMIALLVTLFAGTVVLTHLDGIVPQSDQTVLSRLAHRHLGGPLYAYVQAATAAVLLLAANTAFNGFPRLLFFMARDGYAPKAFLHMGDRLAFSNGIIALAVVAGLIFVAFGGRTESLIHLYAVSVFLAFTLSQAGMVVHWWRNREAHWRRSLTVNAAGAVLSAVVLLIAAITTSGSTTSCGCARLALRHPDGSHYRRHRPGPRSGLPGSRRQRRVPSSWDIWWWCWSPSCTARPCERWPTPPPWANRSWPSISVPTRKKPTASAATGTPGGTTSDSRLSSPPTAPSSPHSPATSKPFTSSDPSSPSP